MRQAAYRLAQFGRHLRPRPLTPQERAQVGAVLTPALEALFWRMTPGEQAHSLQVYASLLEQGHSQRELLQAALLHDIGKTRAPLNLAERSLAVLAGRLLPGAAARWGRGAPRGWRRPFVTAAQHPAWGAEMCAQAGAPAQTVSLVRRHQSPASGASPEDALLRALQAADNDA
jgi:putative nucleotidyltransferase with HDIG domain